ncbi:MAG: hypothetical protein H7X86_03275 [Gorillibacterium sp.]|nr:hypothetical protein [Gorillibacterium sp.]
MTTVWGAMKPKVSVEMTQGLFTGSVNEFTLNDEWLSYTFSLQGAGKVNKIVTSFASNLNFEEFLVVAPNNEDIKYAHRSHTMNLGFTFQHPDRRFGDNWFFTPPPFVFPVRIGSLWYGIALAAKPGKNLYSGWTYRPSGDGSYKLEVIYDGYYEAEGEACTLFFSKSGCKEPYEVISKYAELLRTIEWAPTPNRQPA